MSSPSAAAAVLDVHELRVELVGGSPVVEDVSFSVRPGEILGIVGESGSGKTTTALAVLAYARPGAQVESGTVAVRDEELARETGARAAADAGKLVSYIAQDPASALNPSLRVGDQIAEMLRYHTDRADGDLAVADVLERVNLPSDRAFQRRFVHQLSGGQQQRLAIAIAIVCSPPVVVMDEPTTGLDVVTQARILTEIDRLRRESRLAIVYVSHDILVVGSIADRIAVMYAGRVDRGRSHGHDPGSPAPPVHPGPRRVRPRPHGAAALAGDSRHRGRRRRTAGGMLFAPRCTQRVARCETEMPALEEIGPPITCAASNGRGRRSSCPTPRTSPRPGRPAYRSSTWSRCGPSSVARRRRRRRGRRLVHGCSGRCVAIVGESGSGKTTIARCVAGLHRPAEGRILLDGAVLAAEAKAARPDARRRIQIVFQNPYDSLNPRHKVRDSVARPARVLRNLSGAQAAAEVAELLELVRLPARLAGRYPGELSGGERQRVAIARALAAKPDLVICDEITSALDVSVQAAVLDLLASLRAELDLALLFISHDLGVVAACPIEFSS